MKWVVDKLDRKQQKLWLSTAKEAKTKERTLMLTQHMLGNSFKKIASTASSQTLFNENSNT